MPKHAILLDTDPGIDDAMALLLALASPELEVLGMTTVFGNSTIEVTTRNALNLLNFAGRADIPVAQGARMPLVLSEVHTAEFVHGDDAMGNIGWHSVHNPAQRLLPIPAAQLIVETVMARPGEVTIVAVGPLTNLALALQLEPRLVSAVREVVIMGGTVLAPGNVSPLAEANIYADPHAAARVFSAGFLLTMAGLDVTLQVKMNDSYLRALAQRSRFGAFIAQIAPFYQDFHRRQHGYPDGQMDVHDPTAVAYLLAPELFKAQRWSMLVEIEGIARGATFADRAGVFWQTPKVNCLMDVDSAGVLRLFAERIAAAG